MDSLSPGARRETKRMAELRRAKTLMRRFLVELKARLDDGLRAKKVTSAQLRLLYEIQRNPGGSGAQIARACVVTPQSAQAMTALAVSRGWVLRGTDEANQRLVTARLTPAGERLLAYADGVLAGIEAEVWAGVAMKDLREMNRVIERGLENLEGE